MDYSLTLLVTVLLLRCSLDSAHDSDAFKATISLIATTEYSSRKELSDIQNEIVLETKDFPVLLSCIANRPIQWTFHGHDLGGVNVNSVEIRRSRQMANSGLEISYNSTVTISKEAGDGVVGLYSCESISNLEHFRNIYIFYNDGKPHFLNRGKSVTVEPNIYEGTVLPCPVSAPTGNPAQEFYVHDYAGWRPRRMNFQFDPRKGFLMEKSIPGAYRCLLAESFEESNSADYVDVQVKNPIDFIVKPKLTSFYTKSGFELRCSSLTEISFVFEDGKWREVEIVYDYRPSALYPYMAVLKYPVVAHKDQGTISCVYENKRRLHSWSYEQTDIDVGLRVEGKGMVCCGVDPDSVHVTVMGCNYAEECLSAKGFLRGETPCSKCTTGDQYESNRPGCKSLLLSKFGGHLVNCTRDGVTDLEMYFVGLDGKLYSGENSDERSNEVMLKMQDDKSAASCSWLPFYFSDTGAITWSIQLVNGQVHVYNELGPGKERIKSSFLSSGAVESILALDKKLFDQLASISCSLPYWTSKTKTADATLLLRNVSHADFSDMLGQCQPTTIDEQSCRDCIHQASILELVSVLAHRTWFYVTGILAIITVTCFTFTKVRGVANGIWSRFYKILGDSLINTTGRVIEPKETSVLDGMR